MQLYYLKSPLWCRYCLHISNPLAFKLSHVFKKEMRAYTQRLSVDWYATHSLRAPVWWASNFLTKVVTRDCLRCPSQLQMQIHASSSLYTSFSQTCQSIDTLTWWIHCWFMILWVLHATQPAVLFTWHCRLFSLSNVRRKEGTNMERVAKSDSHR